jgi:tape measure domain-containing protein
MSGGYDLASLGIEVRSDGVLVATKNLKEMTRAARDAEKQTKDTGNAAKGASSSFDSMSRSMSFMSNVLKLELLRRASDIMYDLGRNVFKANLEMQSINNTFKAATGSASLGAQEMQFLRDESKRLGLDLVTAADAHRTLTAAARGTVLEGEQARNIFLAVAEASTVLGLSSQKTEMSLYALQQMISKGVVSMEELRRQLGDQIPGAFQIAARSMGMTEKDFNKLVESGQLFTSDFMPAFVKAMREQFAGGVEDASQSARAELNRFNNAILELKLEIGNAGFFTAMTEALRDFAKTLDDPNMKENMRALGELLGKLVSGTANFAKYASVGSVLGTQQKMRDLVASGDMSVDEYDRLWDKQGGWMGVKNLGTKSITEDLENQYEVQVRVNQLLKDREERQKEIARLSNPAQMSRELEQAAAESLGIAQREKDQQLRLNEAREKGFDEWKKSIANIDDKQRAINKLNDDYNAKMVTGISALKKYGLSEEQAKALSEGQNIVGMDVLSPEARRAAEQAKEQFAMAKQYRDKEEQDIIDREDRTSKKALDEANKRQKKINDITQDLAKLTMSDLDRELLNIDLKFAEVAAELGNIPPQLVQWRDLQRELVQQNFADAMRDAMNDYAIQLKEAEVATSGVGAAALEVFSLQAEKAKELTNIRKEYYRVGADNSFYEELSAIVAKQFDLRIGAAEYAASWEEVSKRLEHVKSLADTTGQGVYQANRDVIQSQLDMVRGDVLLDPIIKARQEMELMVRLAVLERDYRKDIAKSMADAYGVRAERLASEGKVSGMYENRIKALNQEKEIANYSYQSAANYAEQAHYLEILAQLSEQIRDMEAEKSLSFSALASGGISEGTTDAHQEIVSFYKNSLPDAVRAASSSFAEFAREVAMGNATAGDAWRALGNIVTDVLSKMLEDMIRVQLQMAIMGMANSLMGSFSGGFNVGGAAGTSTGTGGGYNMGGGRVTGLHDGGIVGTDASFYRNVDMSMFANAPRFHKGLMPDEFPAILKRKEGVFTEEQMKALGEGSGGRQQGMTVNIHEAPGTSVQAKQSPDGMSVDVIVEMVESRMQQRVDHGRSGVSKKRAYL